MVSSNLPFRSGPQPLLVPRLFFWSSDKVKMLAGTAECSDSVGGWVPGTKPVPGSAFY